MQSKHMAVFKANNIKEQWVWGGVSIDLGINFCIVDNFGLQKKLNSVSMIKKIEE